MKVRVFLFLCLSVAMTGSVPSLLVAQKNQEVTSMEEYYKKWLDQDITYIITPDERSVFENLSNNDERDQFIEQFWRRRDPVPYTPENEYQIEHYRRIQYANERFHAGIPGWKTDRGRIYITWGEPDEIVSYPAGGPYQRKAHEGGGTTSVYPFEVWRYRFLDSVGDDVELEFVNVAGGNLYKLTMDAQEKDEFLHVPGMGLTNAELMDPKFGGQKSWERVVGIRSSGLAHNQGIYFERAKDMPFMKAELLMKISKAPPIRFDDLKAHITAQVTYNSLPFRVVSDFIRIDSENYMVPVTLDFNPEDISFESVGEIWHSKLQVYGLITTLSNRRVFEFDDEILAEYNSRQLELAKQVNPSYQRKIAMRPGRYKLDLVVKDTVSENIGTQSLGINVPSNPEGRLATSSIILAKGIEEGGQDLSQPYLFGIYKIKPQVNRTFDAGGSLGFYLEAYNFAVDQTSQKPVLEIKYGFARPGKEPESMRPITRGVTLDGDRIYFARMYQLNDIKEGRHDLVITIKDSLTGQTASEKVTFTVRQPVAGNQ